MLRHVLFPLLLATAPLALAVPFQLGCSSVTDVGAPGSGLTQRKCTYSGTSLAEAYRFYLEFEQYEQPPSKRAFVAHLLPAQLPERDTQHSINGQTHYEVSWQGPDQVQVVLTQEGDFPGKDTYRFRYENGLVQITRLYQVP